MDAPLTSSKSSGPGQLRSGHIGLMQIVGQCFSIGPLIDIALFLGIVAALAGAAGPLAVLLAAAGMITFSMVIAYYASETGGAGAIGDYIGRAWGRLAGVGALGIYVLSLLFAGAAGFTIAVGELAERFAKTYTGVDFPWWMGASAVALIAWILNVRGASLATRAQLLIVSVSVIPFLLTGAAAIWHAGAANTLSVFIWPNPHGSDLFGALLFSILLFGGFETAGSLAEESKNPRRNIPLALVGTVSAAALLLVFCSYAGTVYYGPQHVAKDWGEAIDGFARIADNLLGYWAGLWIRVAVLVDFAATCIGFTVAASRGIFALSRDRLLHRSWADTNKNGSPRTASTVVLVCALLTVLGGFLVPGDKRFETLFVAATAQALLLVLVYAALALGALRLMIVNKSGISWWRWIIFPTAMIAPALALYGTFVPFPDFPENIGIFIALSALFTVGLWVFVLRFLPDGPLHPAHSIKG
jgi:amino acid transporter